MTDPVRAAAEQLAREVAREVAQCSTGFFPIVHVTDVIEFVLRQHVEAEQKAKVDGWCDVCAGTGKVTSADRCICDGTGLAAQAMVNLRVALVKTQQERDSITRVAEARIATLKAVMRDVMLKSHKADCLCCGCEIARELVSAS